MKKAVAVILALSIVLALCACSKASAYLEPENADEMYALALTYLGEDGQEKDADKAWEWCQKAAEAGNADAMYTLAKMYGCDYGIEYDGLINTVKALIRIRKNGWTEEYTSYDTSLEWLEKAAQAGSVDAMLELSDGAYYYATDPVKAQELLLQAAEAGSVCAMCELSSWYYWGFDTVSEQDREMALQWCEKAAQTGETKAMSAMAALYHYGNIEERDSTIALQWYEKAAQTGDAFAMNKLGEVYYKGEITGRDLSTAFQWYEKAANAGDADAMYNTSVMYMVGEGVKQDKDKGQEWLKKAESAGYEFEEEYTDYLVIKKGGYTEIQYFGSDEAILSYYDAVNTEDVTERLALLEQAAEDGSIDAMFELGDMYFSGFDTEEDYAVALKWYEKALAASETEDYKDVLNMNIGRTSFLAGQLYYYGNTFEGSNVEGDYAKAAEYFKKAVDTGGEYAASSMACIADMYRNGKGVEQNYDTALEWYKKAADAGDSIALKSIAEMHLNGQGAEQSLIKFLEYMDEYRTAIIAEDMKDIILGQEYSGTGY